MNGSQNQHRIAGINFRNQGGEIILLDAVGGVLPLTGITGKASADILLADIEAGYFSLVFQLFSDTGFQCIAGNRAITENVFCGFSAIQRDS